jgi:hypothetical protein
MSGKPDDCVSKSWYINSRWVVLMSMPLVQYSHNLTFCMHVLYLIYPHTLPSFSEFHPTFPVWPGLIAGPSARPWAVTGVTPWSTTFTRVTGTTGTGFPLAASILNGLCSSFSTPSRSVHITFLVVCLGSDTSSLSSILLMPLARV